MKRSDWNGFFGAGQNLDSVGRITIPDEMAEAADITKDAVLVGMLDRFEIWNPERYEQVKSLDKARLGKALEVVE